mmetsp:Transcript_10556/g.14235  ORF Transcript_10556/g.14235 Transcript_10556/m.14235 type:complete len:100 (+) Transcript_10556:708-1007(+)
MMMEMLDIESLFGPKWPKQVGDLCILLGPESEGCAFVKSIPVGPLAGGDITGYSEIGMQQLEHLAQIAITGRFQRYEELFLMHQLFGIRAKVVDVSRIE